jgi:hypothetical protein
VGGPDPEPDLDTGVSFLRKLEPVFLREDSFTIVPAARNTRRPQKVGLEMDSRVMRLNEDSCTWTQLEHCRLMYNQAQ